MISKTTSSNFVKFGTIVQNIPDEDFIVEEFTTQRRKSTIFILIIKLFIWKLLKEWPWLVLSVFPK